MSKFAVIFAIAVGFSILSTLVVGLQLLASSGPSAGGVYAFEAASVAPSPPIVSVSFASGGWIFVGGLWIWRGKMRSRWESLGFDSEVFELFVRMRGGTTRVKLLTSLLIPKDRFQLAHELGLDWKAVDRQITLLDKYGFVEEQVAYGRIRIYGLTYQGQKLLGLLKSLNEDEAQKTLASLPDALKRVGN